MFNRATGSCQEANHAGLTAYMRIGCRVIN
jgi:hypothetical protein